MKELELNIIADDATIKDALEKINALGESTNRTIFVLDKEEKLVGSITDGDLRRALLRGVSILAGIQEAMNKEFSKLVINEFSLTEIDELKKRKINIVPIVDKDDRIDRVINFEETQSVLPVDALIMAGGLGSRLKPLTDNVPKPLLRVGDKPIIQYNVDRLRLFGISNINISIRYLGQQLIDYFNRSEAVLPRPKFVEEVEPLGTLGALSLVESWDNDYILVMNSDLLTDIDFEDFFKETIKQDADMAVATIPYDVSIPYAVLETEGTNISSFAEKPTYTYYSNGGIYLIKKEHIAKVPKNDFYNATDLLDLLLKEQYKVISYPLRGYWLDIGKHEDFKKAQEDIKHLKL